MRLVGVSDCSSFGSRTSLLLCTVWACWDCIQDCKESDKDKEATFRRNHKDELSSRRRPGFGFFFFLLLYMHIAKNGKFNCCFNCFHFQGHCETNHLHTPFSFIFSLKTLKKKKKGTKSANMVRWFYYSAASLYCKRFQSVTCKSKEMNALYKEDINTVCCVSMRKFCE